MQIEDITSALNKYLEDKKTTPRMLLNLPLLSIRYYEISN